MLSTRVAALLKPRHRRCDFRLSASYVETRSTPRNRLAPKKNQNKQQIVVRRNRGSIPRPIPNGVPKVLTTKLFYHQNNSLDPGVGLSARQVFRMNGAYDPDLTGGGHQPLYFDQLMALYTNCYVTHMKITVRPVTNVTPSDVVGGYIALLISPSGVETLPDYDAFLENVKSQRLPYRTVGSFSQMAWNRKEDGITLERNIPRLFGISQSAYVGNVDYANTAGGYPTDQYYVELVYMNMGGNNPVSMMFDCMLEYTCVFTEPVVQASS